MKDRIIQYIETRGLDKGNRRREVNYKRIILSKILREEGYTLQQIGRMFSRNHATIINMLKNYEVLKLYSDFREAEDEMKEELKIETLEEKILKINNMADLHWLQEDIKKSLTL